jgi:hypothetical protein
LVTLGCLVSSVGCKCRHVDIQGAHGDQADRADRATAQVCPPGFVTLRRTACHMPGGVGTQHRIACHMPVYSTPHARPVEGNRPYPPISAFNPSSTENLPFGSARTLRLHAFTFNPPAGAGFRARPEATLHLIASERGQRERRGQRLMAYLFACKQALP